MAEKRDQARKAKPIPFEEVVEKLLKATPEPKRDKGIGTKGKKRSKN